jgi:hypothetical protein
MQQPRQTMMIPYFPPPINITTRGNTVEISFVVISVEVGGKKLRSQANRNTDIECGIYWFQAGLNDHEGVGSGN